MRPDSADERQCNVTKITESGDSSLPIGMSGADEGCFEADEWPLAAWFSELAERTMLTPPSGLPEALITLAAQVSPALRPSWELRDATGRSLWRVGSAEGHSASVETALWGFRHRLAVGNGAVPRWLGWLPHCWQQSHWMALQADRCQRETPELRVGSALVFGDAVIWADATARQWLPPKAQFDPTGVSELEAKGFHVDLRPQAELRRVLIHPDRRRGCLTGREAEVVEGVAQGLNYRQIGSRLNMAPSTVSTHLYNAFAKLGVKSRTELMLLYRSRLAPERDQRGRSG